MFPDHKSKNRQERFREFARTVPEVIDPAFLVVTGDLIHGSPFGFELVSFRHWGLTFRPPFSDDVQRKTTMEFIQSSMLKSGSSTMPF